MTYRAKYIVDKVSKDRSGLKSGRLLRSNLSDTVPDGIVLLGQFEVAEGQGAEDMLILGKEFYIDFTPAD